MPLIRPTFERVQLSDPPLQLVVAQVQFQPVLGIADPKFVAPFQQAIAKAFPRLTRTSSLELSVGPAGVELCRSEELCR